MDNVGYIILTLLAGRLLAGQIAGAIDRKYGRYVTLANWTSEHPF